MCKMFFTPSQQVSLEITRTPVVNRGDCISVPLHRLQQLGTAPVPRHIDIMFSIERCHLCGVSATWAVFMKFVCTQDTTYDRLTA